MTTFLFTINYIALGLLIIGLISILKNNFKIRDAAFLIGTLLLTLGALLSWSVNKDFEIFAFALLFSVQVVANILQITSGNDKLNTSILLFISVSLFIVFFLAGLFANSFFFLIALGTIIAGFGYKEPPKHAMRQSTLFAIAAVFESLFSYFTQQYFYIFLNLIFILFAILIIRKCLHGKRRIIKQVSCSQMS